MSTRANVLVKDKYSEQWYYRHSDGYPSCTAESLKKFIQWLVDGKIRSNVCQGSPWLIVIGNQEYSESDNIGGGKEPTGGTFGWKVGAYETTDGEHGDIAFLYTIDMKEKTVTIRDVYDGSSNTYSYSDFLKTNFENNQRTHSARTS